MDDTKKKIFTITKLCEDCILKFKSLDEYNKLLAEAVKDDEPDGAYIAELHKHINEIKDEIAKKKKEIQDTDPFNYFGKKLLNAPKDFNAGLNFLKEQKAKLEAQPQSPPTTTSTTAEAPPVPHTTASQPSPTISSTTKPQQPQTTQSAPPTSTPAQANLATTAKQLSSVFTTTTTTTTKMGLTINEDLILDCNDVQLIAKLAAGSYGEVWKGKWGDIIVAVKKLSLSATEIVRELQTEVEVIAKLRHPNVIQIYGVCLPSDTEIWIVMELADGGSLYKCLSDQARTVTWGERWHLAIEAARAVAYVHSRRVLHRDLKSPNFLLAKGSIKLADFGMSTNIKLASKTKSNMGERPLGSVRWLAPETSAKVPVFNDKSDVFSLGMVLWEIASRKIPFGDVAEDAQVLMLIKYEKERPTIPADCPEPFAAIIQKCWDDNPANRPVASEVVYLLDASMPKDYPAPAPSPSPPSSPGSSSRKYFEVSRDLLLACVPKDRVRTLTVPPTLPPSAKIGFAPPPSIDIVHLLPRTADEADKMHMLMSERYDVSVFNRVEKYFCRFYSPHSAAATVSLDAVDVILNPALEAQFAVANAIYEKQFSGLSEMKQNGTPEQQQEFLDHLLTSKNLVPEVSSNPISAWHGASSKYLDSISWYGLLNLSTLDEGYYGKGIYLTQEPRYGEFYAETMKVKGDGKFSLLLCWVLLGRPYAVTKVQLGTPVASGFTSHYTLVRKKRASPEVCRTEQDFAKVKGINTFFPIVKGEEIQGDEIVVFESAHVLPRFVVHYSVHTQATNSPSPQQKQTTSQPQPQPLSPSPQLQKLASSQPPSSAAQPSPKSQKKGLFSFLSK